MKKITRPLLLLLIPLCCLGQTASPTGFSYTPSVTVVGLFDAGNTDKATTEYCSVSGTGSYNPDKVRTTGGGQNIDHSAAKPTGNYKYYKGEKLVVAPGESFDLSVAHSNNYSISMVWVDWNGDNDFADNGEQVVVFGVKDQKNNDPLFNTTINVPANALPGLVRMRVLTGDAWTSDPSAVPCGEIANSTTKDFDVEIVGKSVMPTIEWNNDIGKFTINSTTASITIDQDSGVISWKSSLALGTYNLTVTAANNKGSATTNYTIVKQARTPTNPLAFNFDIDGDDEDWISYGSSTRLVVNDIMTFKPNQEHRDDNIQYNKGFDAAKACYAHVVLKVNSNNANYLTINSGGSIIKSVELDKAAEGFVTYDLKLEGNAKWTGTIANVRVRLGAVGTGVSPAGAGDSYEFDRIVFDCNEHLAPSGFYYTPNQQVAAFGKSANSKAPKVNWHNDPGTFRLIQNIEGISIDANTGIIRWSDQVAVGVYSLTVVSKNSAGEISTTYILKVEKPVVRAPSDFSYTPNRITIVRHDGGKTIVPNINWNNHQGTFAFVGGVDPAIILNAQTGQITWKESMAVGSHNLTISATNEAGTITAEFKLIKEEPKILYDFGYRPSQKTILMQESGKTDPPGINWNGAPGTFVLTSPLPSGLSFDAETGVITWGNLQPGIYSINVQAENEGGEAHAIFTLTVNGPNGTAGFDKETFSIMQNYPNPASDLTYFPYNITRRGSITIEVISMNGSVVKTILNQKRQRAGLHLLNN